MYFTFLDLEIISNSREMITFVTQPIMSHDSWANAVVNFPSNGTSLRSNAKKNSQCIHDVKNLLPLITLDDFLLCVNRLFINLNSFLISLNRTNTFHKDGNKIYKSFKIRALRWIKTRNWFFGSRRFKRVKFKDHNLHQKKNFEISTNYS